jgi:hypothetical protein
VVFSEKLDVDVQETREDEHDERFGLGTLAAVAGRRDQ